MLKVGKKLDEYTKNGPLSLVLIMTFFIILGHFFACGWFLLGIEQYDNHIAGWIAYRLQETNYDQDLGDANSNSGAAPSDIIYREGELYEYDIYTYILKYQSQNPMGC